MTKSKVYVIRIETSSDYSKLEKKLEKISIIKDMDLVEEYEGSIDDPEEYSAVKHELEKCWYVWDNMYDERVCDKDGNPKRFDTEDAAQDFIQELLAREGI